MEKRIKNIMRMKLAVLMKEMGEHPDPQRYLEVEETVLISKLLSVPYQYLRTDLGKERTLEYLKARQTMLGSPSGLKLPIPFGALDFFDSTKSPEPKQGENDR
jgi:hypothetical protein